MDVLIEGTNSNGLFDDPTDVLLVYTITSADLAANPESADFPYEVCVPWDGRDGNGNLVGVGDITISGFYSQGVYHFPVYDAEFNDDGFIVETIIPAGLGVQKVYYDDTLIPSNSQTSEPKNGNNGCIGPCHRWTGEWELISDKTTIVLRI